MNRLKRGVSAGVMVWLMVFGASTAAQTPTIGGLADQIKALADQIKLLVLPPPSPLPPTITCPANQAASTTSASAVVIYPAPVLLNGAPPVVVGAVPASGSLFPIGITSVSVTATDALGRSAPPCAFTVTVSAVPPPPPLGGLAITGLSGPAVHKGSLTLTGRGFGAHANYSGGTAFLAAAWNDFASAINGGNLALDGTNNAAWTRETTGGRPNSLGWAKKTFNAATPDSIRRLGSLSLTERNTTGTVFASFYLRAAPGSSGKFWRIYGGAGDVFFSNAGEAGTLSGFSSVSGSPAVTTLWGSIAPPIAVNGWQRIDVYLRDTAGDDYLAAWIDGVRAMQRGSRLPSLHRDIEGSLSNEREQWIVSPWGGNTHTIDFGNMIDAGSWGIADAFVDYTQARVEISDSATWTGATHKEIQIPTAWADGSLTITVNRGSFASLSGKYVYVVTSAGVVTPAFLIP
jgi:hypothetical protein